VVPLLGAGQVQLVYDFLLNYAFGKAFTRDDLLDSLILLRDGFTGSGAQEIQTLQQALDASVSQSTERLVSL
jgi:hypothetical protein